MGESMPAARISSDMPMNRHRPTRAPLTFIVNALGLAARSYAAAALPTFTGKYAGARYPGFSFGLRFFILVHQVDHPTKAPLKMCAKFLTISP